MWDVSTLIHFAFALFMYNYGSHLIAAVGSRVLMYDAADGDLLHSLKGHKDGLLTWTPHGHLVTSPRKSCNFDFDCAVIDPASLGITKLMSWFMLEVIRLH
ncbi:hypothetical protein KC19_9G104700 [Ceratodon purpureus]|uniref:Uncharacterized protein n=1 Tax=Ceratodon purpureus TaxID=3225 RepID=A0A8T0GSI1_CERPU|nr:hypothetical protein KC19_9G104700 [Ceratodon purpureus]